MINWFKYFFLSIFSNAQAKKSVKYGFGTVLLTCFLAVVFMFLGLYAAETVSFFAYLSGAAEFRSFVNNAFNEAGLSVTVRENKAIILYENKSVVIDTAANDGDKAKYSLNDYNLFVDSRNVSQIFDDFEAYCQSVKDGSEIPYVDYLSLPSSEKSDYTFCVKYSGKQKEITQKDVEYYVDYLASASDETVKAEYKKLTDNFNGLSADEYNAKLYALYVKAYYPDLYSAAGEQTPTLRGYYFKRAMDSDGKYICLFGDMSVISFKSYADNTVAFGGIYKDGNVYDGSNGKGNAEAFIKNLYYDGASTLLIVELFDSLLVIAITELIIVVAMLLCFAVCRTKKLEAGYIFGKSVKLVSSYSHTAALLTFLAVFCLGFLIRGRILTVVAYVLFALIMLARTAVLLACEIKRGEKHVDAEEIVETQAE